MVVLLLRVFVVDVVVETNENWLRQSDFFQVSPVTLISPAVILNFWSKYVWNHWSIGGEFLASQNGHIYQENMCLRMLEILAIGVVLEYVGILNLQFTLLWCPWKLVIKLTHTKKVGPNHL